MPLQTLRRSDPRIDPDQMYVAIMSFVGPDEITIHEGDRLRGTGPHVQKHWKFFVLDGLSTNEMHSERQKRFPGAR